MKRFLKENSLVDWYLAEIEYHINFFIKTGRFYNNLSIFIEGYLGHILVYYAKKCLLFIDV